jgi:hypothetical protein
MASRMNVHRRIIIAIGLLVGVGMTLATWLFNGESSPVHEYAIWHTGIGNVLITLNLPAIVLGVVVSGNVHQPSEIVTYTAIFIQWTALGSLGAWMILQLIAGVERKGDA